MNSLPTSDSWIGRTIGDNQRYRLEKRLGGGGMGDVFLAMDTRLGQQVALKLLKDTLVASKEMRKRFEREVEVCAALQSDHIVKVTDCGVTDEKFPFYVMEYLRGETLRELLQREKRLSVEHTLNIITQVCKGLQLAHQGVTLWRNGATKSEHIQVVHRDLKPDNIFLVSTPEELVKIVDFGIAKIRNESSEFTNLTSTFLGTFRYAAPEQLKGEINLDGRADIYSLGIILYEMLSKADPFGFSIKARSMSEASWIVAHTSEPPTPLRSQSGCENLSPQLEAVVMRCLQKEPDKRFATVEKLNQALQAAVNSNFSGVGIVEETIAQPEGSFKETIFRPLTPTPAKREETIVQPPPAPQPTPDPTPAKREETIVQPPPAPQPTPDLTPAKREETIVQPQKNSPPLKAGITIAVVAIACIGGVFAYPLVTSLLALNEIKNFNAIANYEECIASSEKVPQDSRIYQEVQIILNKCRMEYAIKLAKANKCLEAYEVNNKIPDHNPLFYQTKVNIEKICIL
ncbi:MAG: serine/threonine protein kinase [Spirirestis rafaelensis WJT71-NPBG6]|jgi:serine/threonine-protein kinase|nr:serine/threonine protein kinase [Spirirestis rafaelensis WJT71-NPBG6]